MKYLILTVFLTIGQASTPVARQTANASARTTHDVQEKSGSELKPPNPSPSVESQTQTSSAEPHDENKSETQPDHNVKVVEFPPVSVKRDKIDWALWVFNAALVIVGFLQWRVLTSQAKIAHNQELQMIEAGKQTREIINQMKDTATRDLRAYVGVSKIKLDISDPRQPIGLVEIQNFGRSPAYKVRHWTGISPQPYPLIATLPPSPATEFSVAVLHPNIPNLGVVALKKRLPDSVVIGTPQWTIYVYGEVIYEDAFGNQRNTYFRFFYGGPEPLQKYQESSGHWYGAMKPYTEGNDAN
jgi:hypothetical protein